ncbi:MAG: asparagine synthase (glutamine-hydrolyzing) [Chryseobacterium sp.]|nr:MAG: asparagine synthase (glutamine-hydrolyzing) [Chryseobacterium sp.]
MAAHYGFISEKPITGERLRAMSEKLRHRGIVEESCIFNGESETVVFGNDSSDTAGTVGMASRAMADGQSSAITVQGETVLIFDGEIYNAEELQEDDKVNGSAELILRLYLQDGAKAFEKIDGVFSLSIFDRRKQKVILARDRFGLRPLFYKQEKGCFSWASEIKALLAFSDAPPRIDWQGVRSNFLYQTSLAPRTCFEGIRSVLPSQALTVDCANLSIDVQDFYQLPLPSKIKPDYKTAVAEIRRLLSESVSQRLRAGAAVANMMSGGIDSTLISALASPEKPQLDAFTVSYGDAEEVEKAEIAAQRFGLKHKVHTVKKRDLWKHLDARLRFFEEPYPGVEVLLDATSYAQQQGFRFILTGNGADELFGGYMHTLKLARWKRLRRLRFSARIMPSSPPGFAKLKNQLQLKDIRDFFRQGQGGMKPIDVDALFLQKKPIVKPKLPQRFNQDSYLGYFWQDMRISLGSHHTYRDDLSASLYGVTFRYPFLSNELVDYTASLPVDYRFNGKTNKPLLRDAAKGILPNEVLQMRKRGFSFPMAEWIGSQREIQNYLENHLLDLQGRNLFNNSTIRRWLKTAKTDADYHRLWQLMTFEIWLKEYFDKAGATVNAE